MMLNMPRKVNDVAGPSDFDWFNGVLHNVSPIGRQMSM